MTAFRFRLARVLDWYRNQSQIEEERLRVFTERAVQARVAFERHRNDVLARQMELIQSPQPRASELTALGSFLRKAKQAEVQLHQRCLNTEQERENQRRITLAAQGRVRLVESLRDRRLSEYRYEADKELEDLASETHLAGIARTLNTG